MIAVVIVDDRVPDGARYRVVVLLANAARFAANAEILLSPPPPVPCSFSSPFLSLGLAVGVGVCRIFPCEIFEVDVEGKLVVVRFTLCGPVCEIPMLDVTFLSWILDRRKSP